MFSSGLILGGHECLCETSQKRHLQRVILFTVNYSIRFNGKDDNVLEHSLTLARSKTSGYALCFQHTPQDLANSYKWKMFDPYIVSLGYEIWYDCPLFV